MFDSSLNHLAITKVQNIYPNLMDPHLHRRNIYLDVVFSIFIVADLKADKTLLNDL